MTQTKPEPVIRPVQPIPSNPTVKKPNLVSKPVGFGAAVIAAAAMFLAQDEGLVNTTYLDIANVPTYCYGKTGPEAVAGGKWSDAECEALLYEEAKKKLKGVYRCITVPLKTNEAAALLRFSYNVGESALCKSTLAKKANSGQPAQLWCQELLKWDKARVKGVLRTVRGLTVRRQSEYRMCIASHKEASNVRAKADTHTAIGQRSRLRLQRRYFRSVCEVQIRWNLPLPGRTA